MMHTLDLANFPVTDTLKMLASLLERITQANDQLKSHTVNQPEPPPSTSTALSTTPSFTRFHARSVPSIDIYSYLARILKYCPTTNECFLSLLVYFDRMSKNAIARTGKPFSIDSFNIHRLIISGIMVSSKFFSDVFFTNSRYAKVGGLPVSELNQLELEFLVLNDFRLAITIEELQRYGDQLLKHWVLEEELKQGGAMYEGGRLSNGSSVTRWDSKYAFEKSTKRSRRVPSTDDTNTSKGGGSKAVKEEDQTENPPYRGHRRDSSYSSTKSLNIVASSYSSLTSSPQQFPQQYSNQDTKTPPGRMHPNSGTSPNSSTLNNSTLANGSSPMRTPFPAGVLNNHHIHKPYQHHTHHQSQHQRSFSLGSTIKRTRSSGSLLNINWSRNGDLNDDFHQKHSSPKPTNPEDHAYRTAAASPFPSGPPPPSSKYSGNGSNITTNGMNVASNLLRRMSHDSPANTNNGYHLPNSYTYNAYQSSSTQSLPTTPVANAPPPIPGVTFNPAAMAAAAHSAAVAALGYARRASLALPPLPRQFHSSNMPSPLSPATPSSETLGPGIRRGSAPTWSGGSTSNGTNGTDSRNVQHNNAGIPNGSSALPIPMTSSGSTVNGSGRIHLHGTNGLNNPAPGSAPDPIRRNSWAIQHNNYPHSASYHYGQYVQSNGHQSHHSRDHSLQNNHLLQTHHGHVHVHRSSSSDSCTSTTSSSSESSNSLNERSGNRINGSDTSSSHKSNGTTKPQD